MVHAASICIGGLGADLDHPVHRHFLWGRQLDAYLGCGTELLAELGDRLRRSGLHDRRAGRDELAPLVVLITRT